MRVHELHPSLVHAPLVLLPTAAIVDLMAVSCGDRALARFGQRLWVAGTVSGIIAGVAGMAASQEVKIEAKEARDMVFLHGLGNTKIVLSALGMTLWRSRRQPTLGSGIFGLVACSMALWTAYLGGEMVYGYGVGVKALARPQDLQASPPLLSREAPRALVRDAARGLGWLFGRAWRMLRGKDSVSREALLPTRERDSIPAVGRPVTGRADEIQPPAI